MFEVGDIIRHIRSDHHYLVVKKKKYFSTHTERVVYVVKSIMDGTELDIHYPLMSFNYEKVA